MKSNDWICRGSQICFTFSFPLFWEKQKYQCPLKIFLKGTLGLCLQLPSRLPLIPCCVSCLVSALWRNTYLEVSSPAWLGLELDKFRGYAPLGLPISAYMCVFDFSQHGTSQHGVWDFIVFSIRITRALFQHILLGIRKPDSHFRFLKSELLLKCLRKEFTLWKKKV